MASAGSTSGAAIYQTNFGYLSAYQRFKLVRAEGSGSNAYYNIISAHTPSLRLDVTNASDASGVKIQLFPDNPAYAQAQRFKFIYDNSNNRGTYRIIPKLSSTRVFTVENGNLAALGLIQLDSSTTNAYHQDWILEAEDELEVSSCKNITIHRQESNNTCGPASARMVLSNFSINKTEAQIKDKAYELSGYMSSGFTYVFALTNTLNYFFQAAGKTTRYEYQDMTNSTTSAYTFVLSLLANANFPTMVQFKNAASTTYLPYTTIGHYGVVGAIKYDTGQNKHYAALSDPFWTSSSNYHAGVWELPIETLFSYNNAHSGFIIMMSTS